MKTLEEMTTSEFLDTHASDLTAEHAFKRAHGGIDRMTLTAAEVANGRLYIHFKTYPTFSKTTTQYNPLSGMKARASYYDTTISYAPFDVDSQTWKAMKENEKIQVLKDLLDNADIQVNCTCPAFMMQGHHEKNARDGVAMYAYHGPRGTGEWEARHKNKTGACKHLYIILGKLVDQYVALLVRKIKIT